MSHITIMLDIVPKKKGAEISSTPCILLGFESVCKPSSVVYGHLSRLAVTDKLKRYSRYSVGRTALLTDTQSCNGWGLHGIPRYRDIGELLPRLSILTETGNLLLGIQGKAKPFRRFISVALSLKSPSPDVIRHPVLCCSDFPHYPFGSRDRITNSNQNYYTTFLKKMHSFPCFFSKKIVKCI